MDSCEFAELIEQKNNLQPLFNIIFQEQMPNEETLSLASTLFFGSIGLSFSSYLNPECLKLIGPTHPNSMHWLGGRVAGSHDEMDLYKAISDQTYLLINAQQSVAQFSEMHFLVTPMLMSALLPLADNISRQKIAAEHSPITYKEFLAILVRAFAAWLYWQKSTGRTDFASSINFTLSMVSALSARMLGGDYQEVRTSFLWTMIENELTLQRLTSLFSQDWPAWYLAKKTAAAAEYASAVVAGDFLEPTILTRIETIITEHFRPEKNMDAIPSEAEVINGLTHNLIQLTAVPKYEAGHPNANGLNTRMIVEPFRTQVLNNLATRFSKKHLSELTRLTDKSQICLSISVNELMDLFQL